MPANRDKRGMTPREWAAYWQLRLDAGDLSPSEHEKFAAWIAVPVHAEAMDCARRVWAAFEEAGGSPHLQAMRKAALAVGPQAVPRHTRRWNTFRALATAVAVLLLMVGTALVAWQFYPLQQLVSPAPSASIDSAPSGSGTYSTQTGERLSVVFQDGTEVTLNTDTALEVLYAEDARRIRLLRGQAFFEVAEVRDWPFIVEAAERRVIALGTAFEVFVTPERFYVTLAHGEVLVEVVPVRDPLVEAATPLHEIILRPGQRLFASTDAAEEVSEVDLERDLRWRTGFVEFHDERLEAAVAEMNRYTTLLVSLQDDRVASLRISGVFRTGQVESFLAILTEVLPISLDRSEESIEIRMAEEPSRSPGGQAGG